MSRFESCLPLHFLVHGGLSSKPDATFSASFLKGSLASMNTETNHISVCICTYKRPEFLKRLIHDLISQETEGLFTYSIVVADNDRLRSAEALVTGFAAASPVKIRYCVQPQQNIALTRNKAIENAEGNFIAFIDDDEFPAKDWLITLYKTCKQYQVDGVLGPVKPYFETPPPEWIIKSNLCERATYPTGLVIDWRKGRTGNVLLKSSLFTSGELPFRPEFRNGEDQDFFQRKIEAGHVFVWCNEAVAHEFVPPIRWNRKFLLRRALLRGSIEPKTVGFGPASLFRSLAAVLAYSVAMPFAFLMGQLLAFVGVNPVKEQYVTE
jgi:succinoglycan biosynthesis protein ExoM